MATLARVTTPAPPAPTPLPTEPPSPGVPVFGKSAGAVAYKRFGLEVERPSTEERWVEEFDVRTDVDGGSLVSMLSQPAGSIQQAQAAIAFLGQQLRDNDGVSVEWAFPATPEEDPESPGDWLRDDPTEEELAVAAAEQREPVGAPLYRWHDDSLMTEEELRDAIRAFDPLTEGSARRRFAYLSDTSSIRYRFEAIEEIAQWLSAGITARPTQRPMPSGHGPRSTGRTSRGR